MTPLKFLTLYNIMNIMANNNEYVLKKYLIIGQTINKVLK